MARVRRPRGLSANYVDEQERLQEILSDKSTLEVRMLDRSNWVKFNCRPACFYCDTKFRPFSLKRHCRGCGEIVCSTCYRRRKVRAGLDAPVYTVPLCFDCIDKAMISAEQHNGKARDDSAIDKRENGDSIKTASTGESFCSRFSAFSAALSEHDEGSASEVSDVSEDDSEVSATSERNPSRQIEFMSEKEQFEIYEARRRELLDQFGVKDPGNEKEYEALCELVSRALDATVAAVGFMGDKAQWYKAKLGISQPELPREIAFCSQLLQTPLPTVILDVSKDPRFSKNPLVTGSAHIRFYATSPICDPDSGVIIGSVFVMDPKPKSKMPQRAIEILSYVATAAERLLADRSQLRRNSMQQKRHSSPSMLLRSRAPPVAPENRPGSLVSVPEDIDGPEFHLHQSSSSTSSSSLSSSLSSSRGSAKSESRSRRKSHGTHPQLQLLDPKLVLSSSSSSKKDNAALKDAEPQRRNTDAGVVHPDTLAKPDAAAVAVAVNSTELARSESGPPAANAAALSSLDRSCFELFYRITTTQQMLVQQQSTLLATLNQHASRIGSIEETVGRIEDMVLTMQHSQSSSDVLLECKRDPNGDAGAA